MSAADRLAARLRQAIRGPVIAGAPLARYTSFGIGGPAGLLATPTDEAELAACLAGARAEGLPVLVLGGGSNILVRDGGFPGLVIRTSGFQELAGEGPAIRAGAGVRIGRLLAFAVRQGLAGLEILAGVPGTVGGAVWGNAGAWGGAVGDRIRGVRVVSADGQAAELPREAIPFRYRASGLPTGSVLTRADLGLTPGDPGEIRRRISGYLVERNRKQPTAFRSAGSIFKNPPGDFAGRLVEAAGLKGARIGNAAVSERHANFILNLGGATAADVLGLAALATRRVRETTGILLELELQVVGVDEPGAGPGGEAPRRRGSNGAGSGRSREEER